MSDADGTSSKESSLSPDMPIRDRLLEIHYEIREIKGYITGKSTCAFAVSTNPILSKLAEAISLQAKQQGLNVENIDKLTKKIYGNGEAGIDDRLRQIERDMAIVRWIAIGVGTAAIGLIITAIYQLIVSHGI